MEEYGQKTFLPEIVDEQIETYLAPSETQQPDISAHTAQALQRYFAPSESEQDAALQRVWQRLAQQRTINQHTSQQRQQRTPVQYKRGYQMQQKNHNTSQLERTGLIGHPSLLAQRLGQITALIFVALLIGSTIVIFQLASHNRQASSPSITSSAPQEKMMFALGNNILYRLDIKTHQPLWHFQVPNGMLTSGEQIVDMTCYIAGMSNNQNRLYALDTANGKVRWQINLSSSLIGYQPSLIAFDDTLYLPSTQNGYPTIEAVAVSNGTKKWEHFLPANQVILQPKKVASSTATPGQVTYAIKPMSLIAASDQAIYGETGNNSERFALSAADGHVLWQKAEDVTNLNTIDRGFIVNNVLCVVKDNGQGVVVGYDAASGEKLWSQSLDGRLSGYGTTLLHGIVYVSTNRQPNQGNSIYAFSAKDGTQIWKYQDTATSGSSYPTVTEQVTYFYRYNNGHNGQTLVALNTSNGKQRWSYDFHDDATVEFAPTADSDQVYLSLPDNTIQILQASDGKSLGTFKAPGKVDPNNRIQLQVIE